MMLHWAFGLPQIHEMLSKVAKMLLWGVCYVHIHFDQAI